MNKIFENEKLLVLDKPAGVEVHDFAEQAAEEFSELRDLKDNRYGLVHRLDKNTSGVLLLAKNEETLNFLQKQFKKRKVTKKYLALVAGKLDYEKNINALIGRDLKNKRKQKAYLPHSPEAQHEGLRKAETKIRPLKLFEKYTLIEASPKTGRKHQIRCHLAFINHPIAGDELYSFKDQAHPENLKRQFLHASYIKIKTPSNTKEFKSELPSDLNSVLKGLKLKQSYK
ncbi:MAG: RluA family pseudouridine synthase [Candidatus Paceibacterota bacterium]